MSVRSAFSRSSIALFKGGDILEELDQPGDPKVDAIEIFRIKVRKFLTQSFVGEIYNVILLFFSVFSMFEHIWQSYLTYEDNNELLNQLNYVEYALASLFGLDWLLNLFVADHRLVFCKSFFSMVDIFTVIPVFATHGKKLSRVHDVHTASDLFFYVMFLMSNTRILRALRVRRYIIHIQDNVKVIKTTYLYHTCALKPYLYTIYQKVY
jgi:hypothetical protein